MGKHQKFGEYFVGVDVGTNSVGWAVTDLNYKLLRFNKKDMWGVRLFDEAKTAAERRLHRTARRRLQRRKWRLNLLQELFAPEMQKLDSTFFQRLKESSLHEEDRSLQFADLIFEQNQEAARHYRQNYKTIYHLRHELATSNEKADLRLLYLALHHIIKYRGHFLFEGQRLEAVQTFQLSYSNLETLFREEWGLDFSSQLAELEEILCQETGSRDKLKRLKPFCVQHSDSKKLESIFRLCIGGKVDLATVFDVASEKIECCFKTDLYEEKRADLEDALDRDIEWVDACKKVYDFILLKKLLRGSKSLSEVKCRSYQEHATQLKQLKQLFRRYLPASTYRTFFKGSEKNSYAYYIDGHQTREEFYKALNVHLKKMLVEEKEDLQHLSSIQSSIEREEYLLKQRVSDNGNLPYQLHLAELEAILERQAVHHPFLAIEIDGLSVMQKIKMLLEFRIPYYVGPLKDGKNSWAIRRSTAVNSSVTPWNFESEIDLEQSAEQFILRLTNQCTYLPSEPVLPKDSLLYAEYSLLNCLNKIEVKGYPLCQEEKRQIVTFFVEEGEKFSTSNLAKFLSKLRDSRLSKGDITGIQDTLSVAYSSYSKFKRVFGDRLQTFEGRQFVEKAIHMSCLYGEDRSLFKKAIERHIENFPISDAEWNGLLRLRFSGWGRLSEKFLVKLPFEVKGEGYYSSVMDALWQTNYNLMELLHYSTLSETLNEEQEVKGQFDLEDYLEQLYLSPSVRRSIIQCYRLVEEVRRITKHDPKRIFVEVARFDGEKGQETVRRRAQLEQHYALMKDAGYLAQDLAKVQAKLSSGNYDDNRLRQKKLYLYFLQLGRCLYTGEEIDLNTLLSTQVYDIDHIYPQSLVKDDSLDNLVLVRKDKNAKKSNHLLDEAVVQSQKSLWTALRQHQLMSTEKYNRLTRRAEFTPEELRGFEARQLVTTRQATLELIRLFEKRFPDSEIVFAKSALASDFRERFELIKLRELNDCHHAHDAYLNIVVGNVHHCKFTRRYYLERKPEYVGYNRKNLYNHEIRDGQALVWCPVKKDEPVTGKETIKLVKAELQKRSVLITKRLLEGKGQLFNLTINSKADDSEGKDRIPNAPKELKARQTKEALISKYGYLDSMKPAYFVIFSYQNRKKRALAVERVCLIEQERAKDVESINKLLVEKGYEEARFIRKLYLNQKIMVAGYPYRVTGFINGGGLELKNDRDLYLDEFETEILKHVIQFRLDNELNPRLPVERYRVRFLKKGSSTDRNETYEEALIRLEKEMLLAMEIILEKLDSKAYTTYLNHDKGGKIRDNWQLLEETNLVKRAEIVCQVTNLLGRGTAANLSFLKMSTAYGRLCRKTIPSLLTSSMQAGKPLQIIDESVTGLFTRNEVIEELDH